mgnify:CR=1 FL=1|jgi:hypothetical protein
MIYQNLLINYENVFLDIHLEIARDVGINFSQLFFINFTKSFILTKIN